MLRPELLGQTGRATEPSARIALRIALDLPEKLTQRCVREAALHDVGAVEAVEAIHTKDALLHRQAHKPPVVETHQRIPVVLALQLDIVQAIELGTRSIEATRGLGNRVKVKVVVAQRLVLFSALDVGQEILDMLHVRLTQRDLCIARAQQVQDKHTAVLVQELLHVLVKGRLRGSAGARDLDACVEGLQSLLLPKDGDRSTQLHVAKELVTVREHRLCLGKVGRVALVVNAACIEACAGLA